MWAALGTAIAALIGKIVLAYLDNRQKAEDAVNAAAKETADDTREIAENQARNNADTPRTADDVAARLRARLQKASGDAGDQNGTK